MKKLVFFSIYCLIAGFAVAGAQTQNGADAQTAAINAAEAAAPRGSAPEMRDLSLTQMLSRIGASLYWDSFFQTGLFTREGHSVSFRIGSRGEEDYVLFDNSLLLQVPLPYNSGGQLFFPEAFAAPVKQNLERFLEQDATHFRIAAIVVDPGHGGRDEGASAEHVINGKKTRVVEKDITLAVSKDLYEKLKAAYPGKRILITRSGDTYPDLEARVAQANAVPLKNNEAVIYVSIHANASFNKKARGYEVWYLDPGHKRELIDKANSEDPPEIRLIKNEMLQEEYNKESEMMAAGIADHFAKNFGKTLPFRGLKAEEWYVVRKARMPSILVELGFVTNPDDAELMTNAEGLKKFSDSIYKGIMDFVTSFEASGGFIAYQ